MTPGPPEDLWGPVLDRALERTGIGPGARVVDVGAGVEGATAALAGLVRPGGVVYALDRDPGVAEMLARETTAGLVVPVTGDADHFTLLEPMDLAFCRFLLLHVARPRRVIEQMAACLRSDGDGWLVVQEPITSAGRVGGQQLSMPEARHQDIGAVLPSLVRDAGLSIEESWAESPAGAGPGPVASYLAELTGVDPGDDAIVLPPLVTVVARRPASVP